ncbi:aldolase [Cephaloticoccus capnophilus]|uniref:Aldolase n=1 Tax=Cephaloticoccus capnophilus TaxID=1548208 RepID=A0A139SKZ6_9BACT|nr:class II aldolase/adducin family protein [Cephaloticoccus capnophilus]KXU35216.1 aldolase [Cephaloticoccus capnophilus]
MPRPANAPESTLEPLLTLAHELGREARNLAILGEGNVSMRRSQSALSETRAGEEAGRTFFVKASGSCLATLGAEGVAECRACELIAALDSRAMSDAEVEAALLGSRVAGDAARKPSVEAMFHAWLLTLPGVNFVGHTHPVAVNAILCSERARDFAAYRCFPDEIVCCGAASVLVPYVDPGLKLAQAIRRDVLAFIEKNGRAPRVILLENHGLIALGATAPAVLAATLMATKAAEIFLAAAALGGPRFLKPEQVARIAGRPDEHYREKVLGLR